MVRKWIRAIVTPAIVVGLFAGGFGLRLPTPLELGPSDALAADATVATCDEQGFNAALNAVQASGGGTIIFSCTGTITFTNQKIVTSNVTIAGNGDVALDGGGSTRHFRVNAGASLELVNLTLQNGNAGNGAPQEFGGAIDNRGELTVIASTFSNNRADFAGAIDISSGTATIISSTFSNNFAPGDGGAIYNLATLEVHDSTFSNNSTDDSGGAIVNTNSAGATISTSTFSGNSALGNGGAIISTSPLAITASTITGGSAGAGLSAIRSIGTTMIQSTVIAGNVGTDCGTSGSGVISSQGSNLSDEASCNFTAAGDIQNSASVNLGALADNGGPTQTILPQAGSDAIDAASCGLSTAEDQRGVSRPQGANCDIGAVETAGTVPVQNFATYNGSGPIDEGGSASIAAIAYGPAGATLDYDFDCDNDGSYETQGTGGGSSGTASCTFNDDGAFTVGVEVCDAADSGNCDTDSTTVIVDNVAPTISQITKDSPIDEGSSSTITVTATDPAGVNDPLQYEFDCDNDGGYEVGPQLSNTTDCMFGDNGDFTVGVRVTDGDGGAATDPTIVTVNNVAPTITDVTNNGPVDEGSAATITVTATDPAGVNDPLTYTFDCDNSGDYETAGVGNQGQCTFSDNGNFTVGVQVSDGDGGVTTDSTTVAVNNVAPTVEAPVANPAPSDEGQSVVASATFSDPGTADTHTCTVDYGDGSGAQAGTVAGNTCTGPPHTYLDDDPSGTASDQYTVTVEVTDDDGDSGSNDSLHTVNNVAPVIDGITTDAPVPQGQPVTITVAASDVGVNDTLTYSFDCDNNGSYETAGVGNEGQCTLDPAAATSTIGVQVIDDDLGVAMDTVVVDQTLVLCANHWTGAVGVPGPAGCGMGSIALTLPGPASTTFCVNIWTGQLQWTPGEQCSASQRVHFVPDSGSLSYCKNMWTGGLRVPPLPGQCSAHEIPGVIPG